MRPAAADDGGGDDGLLERRVQAHVLRRVTRGAVVVRHQESPAGEAAVQRGNAATLRREAQVRCLSFSTLAHHRPLAPCLGLLLQHLASFLSQGAEAPATRSPRVKSRWLGWKQVFKDQTQMTADQGAHINGGSVHAGQTATKPPCRVKIS